MTLLGFDPGRDKCGLALVGDDRAIGEHRVVSAVEALSTICDWCDRYGVETLVMGDRTTSKQWKQQIEPILPPSIEIVRIDERYSTLEARDRYWQLYPPKGLTRLVPRGMRTPPRAIDDIVAIILVERYLQQPSNRD